jgi:hypothetical protein
VGETLGMATALSALANATATFQVAGTGVVTDPATGNVLAVTQTVTVPLFLKGERVQVTPFPGVDAADAVYEGYATEALDARVLVGSKGTLVFGSADATECEVLALRLPYGDSGLIGPVLNRALGERIVLVVRGQR